MRKVTLSSIAGLVWREILTSRPALDLDKNPDTMNVSLVWEGCEEPPNPEDLDILKLARVQVIIAAQISEEDSLKRSV